jgi:hypothetical protein
MTMAEIATSKWLWERELAGRGCCRVYACTGPCQRWMWGLYWPAPIMHVSASFVSSSFSLYLSMNSSASVLLSWIIGRACQTLSWTRRWYGRRPCLGLPDMCGGGKGGEIHGRIGMEIRYLLSSGYLPCPDPCMTGSFDRATGYDSLYMLVGTKL